jgi:hypothetical protein
MDGERFDAWTRRLAGLRSRRTVVAAALGGILGAVGLAGPDPAGADNLCKPAGKKCNKDAQCCAGLACVDGRCQDRCAGVVCTADQCHVAGTCDPGTGACSDPTLAPQGTACADGNPLCVGGACCTAAGRVVVHGGCFESCGVGDLCPCGTGCQLIFDGSGGDIGVCGTIDGGPCLTSNDECPLGFACVPGADRCIAPC